jgi:hypothetical protein
MVEFLCVVDADVWRGMAEARDLRDRTALQLLPPAHLGRTTNLWRAALKGDFSRVRSILATLKLIEVDPHETEGLVEPVDNGGEPDHGADVEGGMEAEVAASKECEDDDLFARTLRPAAESYGAVYGDGINSKTRRMKWSCLHACIAGIVQRKKGEMERVNLLQFLVQVLYIQTTVARALLVTWYTH